MTLEVNRQVDVAYLSRQDEEELVHKLTDIWRLGEEALKPTRDRKKKIIRAYNTQHEDLLLKRKGSKGFLPWVYRAHEVAHARLSNALVPNDEDTFNLTGETDDDHEGVQMMDQYLKAVFDKMGFDALMDDAFKELTFGEVVLRAYWRKDQKESTSIGLVPVLDESGQPLLNELGQPLTAPGPVKTVETLYNNVYFEVINTEDFVFYPITGDMTRATVSFRVWRHIDELEDAQAAGSYRNVELIRQDMSCSEAHCNLRQQARGESDHQGLEVKEYWIHRINIGGVVYKNMIATVVEDQYLIRFERNPYDFGLRPFIYCPLVKNYNENTGHALTDRALEIQKMANFVVNQIFDESKIKLFGFYKYRDDDVFNPANFIARAGGLIRVGDLNNVQPVNPNIGALSFGVAELQYFENQFDLSTGIPKFLKGVPDLGPKDTATAKRLEAEGSDTLFRMIARRINANLLKPMVMAAYTLVRQFALSDPEVMLNIARTTQKSREAVLDQTGQLIGYRDLTPQELLTKLPAMPPLSKIDVKIVGFENVLTKQDKAVKLERFISGIAQFAQLRPDVLDAIKERPTLENYARFLSIDHEMIRSDREMASLQRQRTLVAMKAREQQLMLQSIQAQRQAAMRPGQPENPKSENA